MKSGDVDGRNVLVVDDFSITGGTLINLAEELKRRGACRILVTLSHILLNEHSLARIEASPIEKVIGTDTVYNPYLEGANKIEIVSVAPLFAEAIDRIHKRESVSPLFSAVPEKVVDYVVDINGVLK